MKTLENKTKLNFSVINKYLLLISCATISSVYLMNFFILFLFYFNDRDVFLNTFLSLFVLLMIALAAIYFKKKKDGALLDVIIWSGLFSYILLITYSYFFDSSVKYFLEEIEGPFGGIMAVFILAIISLSFYLFLFIYSIKHVSRRFEKLFKIIYLLLGAILAQFFISNIEDIASSEKIANFLVPSVFVLYLNYYLIKTKNIFLKMKNNK